MRPLFLSAAVLAASAAPAAAHVVLSPDRAAAGSYYAGELRIGHGCADAPTVSLRVEIPAEALSAKPQPKPGWRIRVEHVRLAEPRAGEDGRPVRDRVAAVTWSGDLPDDRFDTFGLMLRLPATAGVLLLPVVQRCRGGEARWTQPPAAGAGRPAHPAPVLTVEAAADPGAHRHDP